ncbi:hypothetical protein PAMP_012849 [Pampus punctatissimus]
METYWGDRVHVGQCAASQGNHIYKLTVIWGRRRRRRRAQRYDAVFLTSTPRCQEASQRLGKLRETLASPDRQTRRTVSGGDEDGREAERETAAPERGYGLQPGAVTAEVCSHCVLSGAGEKDASAAAHSPPTTAQTRVYSPTESVFPAADS